MTWLHKFFGLFFIPADNQAQSAQQLFLKVLPFHPYISMNHTIKEPPGDTLILI